MPPLDAHITAGPRVTVQILLTVAAGRGRLLVDCRTLVSLKRQEERSQKPKGKPEGKYDARSLKKHLMSHKPDLDYSWGEETGLN